MKRRQLTQWCTKCLYYTKPAYMIACVDLCGMQGASLTSTVNSHYAAVNASPGQAPFATTRHIRSRRSFCEYMDICKYALIGVQLSVQSKSCACVAWHVVTVACIRRTTFAARMHLKCVWRCRHQQHQSNQRTKACLPRPSEIVQQDSTCI